MFFSSLIFTTATAALANAENIRGGGADAASATRSAVEEAMALRAKERTEFHISLVHPENQRCHEPDCFLHTGTYPDPYGNELNWWAFVPAACRERNCPLYVATDGTMPEGEGGAFKPESQQRWMEEMNHRGYVGVTYDYANSELDFGFCYGQHVWNWAVEAIFGNVPGVARYGVVDKAQHVFDPEMDRSIVSQVCHGANALANCDLGIAAGGISQGAMISALGSNFNNQVSAVLLYAVGDVVQMLRDALPFGSAEYSTGDHYSDWDLECMDSISIPAVRRRMINGDKDEFFGRDAAGTIRQYKRMVDSYYDCQDAHDCLTRPLALVQDSYIGGDAVIANEGGYHIMEGGNRDWTHTNWNWDHFNNGGDIWNAPAGFDWLARTARIVPLPGSATLYSAGDGKPTGGSEDVEMTLDLGHWVEHDTLRSLHVEWARGNGSLGRRRVVGKNEKKTFTAAQVPADTPGFRVTAITNDELFLDQVSVVGGKIVSFGEIDGRGWCVSLDPNGGHHSTAQCIDDIAYKCIDFCSDEKWHPCDVNKVSECVAKKDEKDDSSFDVAQS